MCICPSFTQGCYVTKEESRRAGGEFHGYCTTPNCGRGKDSSIPNTSNHTIGSQSTGKEAHQSHFYCFHFTHDIGSPANTHTGIC